MKIYAYTSYYTHELLEVYSSVESAKKHNPRLVFEPIGEDSYATYENGERDGYLQSWNIL